MISYVYNSYVWYGMVWYCKDLSLALIVFIHIPTLQCETCVRLVYIYSKLALYMLNRYILSNSFQLRAEVDVVGFFVGCPLGF